MREELDLKRNEMLEQEQRLVEVMREACVVRREAAAAKDGQEELLLQAVLEGSKEAFLCRQVTGSEARQLDRKVSSDTINLCCP